MDSEEPAVTPIQCIKRPLNRPCAGRTVVVRIEDEIQWICLECKNKGIISCWRGTPWDLSRWASSDRSDEINLLISQAEYSALIHIPVGSQEEEAILAGAVWQYGRVVVTGSPDVFDRLSRSIACEAELTKERRLQVDLDGITELIDALLEDNG